MVKPPQIKTSPDRTVTIPTAQKFKPDQTPREDTTPAPDPRKLRAEFRPEEFARTIRQHGKHCLWRKALLCPCFQGDTQQADPVCKRCDGSGFFYVEPMAIQALIFSVEKKMNILEKQGSWLSGRASATVLPRHRLGYRDSLELRDSIAGFDEYLTKANRRGIRSKLAKGFDSARYRIVNVVYLQYLDTEKDELHTLEEGKHFEVKRPDGWLQWLPAGNALVPDGATFTLRYEYSPIYIVEQWPHAFRDDFQSKKSGVGSEVVALPIQAVVMLDYLVNDTPNKSNLPTTW